MSARLALGRWAWRLVRREWRQHLLVLSLITASIAAATLGVWTAHNSVRAPSDQFGTATHELGFFDTPGASIADSIDAAGIVFETIDASSATQGHLEGSTDEYTITDRGETSVFGGETFRLHEGRMPQRLGEAAVAKGRAAIGVITGERIEVAGHSFEVVGLGEDPSDLSHSVIVVTAGAVPDPTSTQVLVEATDAQLQRFNDMTRGGFSFEDLAERDRQRLLSVVAAFALSTVAMLEVVLLCAAGFAVMARRRIRELGMLGAIGATERHLRHAVTINGVAVGLVGGAVGVSVGLASAVVARPAIENALGHRIAVSSIPWLSVVPLVGLAALAAGAAAWWPARSLARQSITDALAARRPAIRSTRRSRWIAVAATALGAVALSVGVRQQRPNLVAAGIVVAVIGVLLLSPSVIALVGNAARHLPLAPRIAARDIARHQSRSSVATAALVVAIAIPVAIVVTTTSGDARDAARPPNLPDNIAIVDQGGTLQGGPISLDPDPVNPAAYLQALQAAAPGARLIPVMVPLPKNPERVMGPGAPANGALPIFVQYPSPDDPTIGFGSSPWIATPELLEAFGLPGEAASTNAAALTTTQIAEFALHGPDASYNPANLLDAETIPLPNHSSAADFWLTPSAVEQLALDQRIGGWLLVAPEPIDDETATDLVRAAAQLEMTVTLQRGPASQAAIRTNAIAAGSVLALTVLAIIVALIRSEQSQDTRTLTAVGAPTRTRRLISGATAGLLALTGVLLAVPAGYLALLAVMSDPTAGFGFVMPANEIAAITIGVPAAAATGGWLLSGREPTNLDRVPAA